MMMCCAVGWTRLEQRDTETQGWMGGLWSALAKCFFVFSGFCGRILSLREYICSPPRRLAIKCRQTGTTGSGFWSMNELFICHMDRNTRKIVLRYVKNRGLKILAKKKKKNQPQKNKWEKGERNSELWCNAGILIQVKLVLYKVKSLHLKSLKLKVLSYILPVHPAHPAHPARPARPAEPTPDLFTSPQRSFNSLWVYRMSCCDGNRWAEREQGRLCSFIHAH